MRIKRPASYRIASSIPIATVWLPTRVLDARSTTDLIECLIPIYSKGVVGRVQDHPKTPDSYTAPLIPVHSNEMDGRVQDQIRTIPACKISLSASWIRIAMR